MPANGEGFAGGLAQCPVFPVQKHVAKHKSGQVEGTHMRFAITGADRETGEDIELVIDAADEEEAMTKASSRGVLVASCDIAIKPSAPPAPPRVPSAARRSASPTALAGPSAQAAPVADDELPELPVATMPQGETLGFGNILSLFQSQPAVACAVVLLFLWAGLMGLVGLAQVAGGIGALGLWNVLIAAAYVVIGIGVMRGRNWGYGWAVVSNFLNALFSLVQVVVQSNPIMLMLLVIEVAIIILLLKNRSLFPKRAEQGDQGQPPSAPSSPWNRFLRGGILGMMDERFCTVSNSDVAVKGNTPGQKALRLGLIAGGTIGVFVLVIFAAAMVGSMTSDESSPAGEGRSTTPSSSTPRATYTPSHTDWSTPTPQPRTYSSHESSGIASDADKADYMRDQGFTQGSTQDLARMYDRIKNLADQKSARDRRLGLDD